MPDEQVDDIVRAEGLTYAALVVGTVGLDALAWPRRGLAPRSFIGWWLLTGMSTLLFGLFLAACGNPIVAVALALSVQALLVTASNAKRTMLGEPLLFSDLALVGAIFRHPQFYLSAVALWQRIVAAAAMIALLAVLAMLFQPDPAPHVAGLALALAASAQLLLTLRLVPPARLAPRPAAYADTQRFGLLPTLLLYWLRWRESRDPPPCPAVPHRTPGNAPSGAPELAIVIQCESFADPDELFGKQTAPALPGLASARARSFLWGNLEVSGFGAYTMRTEYGVLFGRSEDDLGFRRYDPLLTALGESSYGLPARLPGWRSLFVHPHDMRFYGRDEVMPAAGFAELVGEAAFDAPAPGAGRYVTDAAMADRILELARTAAEPSLIYAVTIENHGPWSPEGDADLIESYLTLVRKGDAMLSRLLAGIAELKRPALLVFFGDHRPSIPGASMPPPPEAEGGRHTPYVMLRLDAEGRVVPGANRRQNLTPAELHHAVLDTILGEPVAGTPSAAVPQPDKSLTPAVAD